MDAEHLEEEAVEERIWYRAIPKPRRSTTVDRGLSLEERRYAASLKGMSSIAAYDAVVGT